MLQFNAYAKINLGLEVLRKRPDGYHDINTVFIRIGLYDAVFLEEAENISVHCLPSLGIPQEENLGYKAAQRLREVFSIQSGAKITIHKHIPNGAGLGGGSSDAASVLRGLCRLWQLDEKDERIFSVAAAIGSDVPYFLQKGAALAEGRGERLTYFRHEPDATVLLIFPDLHISTPWAYKALQVHEEGRTGRALRDIVLMSNYEKEHLKNYLVNDFEKVVFAEYPQIADIKNMLYNAGAYYAQMSGSGSSVFGLFGNEANALRAALKFRNYRTFVCPIMGGEIV